MTVHELILALSAMPQDLPALVNGEHVDRVWLNDEHYFGDYANPNCKVEAAVEIE